MGDRKTREAAGRSKPLPVVAMAIVKTVSVLSPFAGSSLVFVF
jgi:hypothetical protein